MTIVMLVQIAALFFAKIGSSIFDEAQRCPDLFSYLQTQIDAERKMGLYVLTGSQQFGLLSGISQSLAGRVAKVSLLPFSLFELQKAKKAPAKLEQLLFKGLYPPLYDRKLEPGIWHNALQWIFTPGEKYPRSWM